MDYKDLAIWDKEDALRRLANNEKLVKRIAQAFLSDIEVSLKNLEQSVEAGDKEASERHSHSIKGSAGNVGAIRLSKMAEYSEECARDGSMDEVTTMLSELKSTADETVVILNEFVG